jgi:hypothetical protein
MGVGGDKASWNNSQAYNTQSAPSPVRVVRNQLTGRTRFRKVPRGTLVSKKGTYVTEPRLALLSDFASCYAVDSTMRSRIVHAVTATAIFIFIAMCYGVITASPIALLPLAAWSTAGVASYIAFSHAFGFDPQRTRIAHFASDWIHYVDRWELRLGQATLSMLGVMVLGAKLFDEAHFVLAVVSGTLSAWIYFACRLYAGGYRCGPRRRAKAI